MKTHRYVDAIIVVAAVALLVGSLMVRRMTLAASRLDVVRECPGLCMLRCTTVSYQKEAITQAEFDEFLSFVSSCPNYALSAYPELITHWETCRENDAARWRDIDSSTYPLSPDVSLRRDVNLLILALYVRSRPPPSFQRACRDGRIQIAQASDPRVRAILLTFLATERSQAKVGAPSPNDAALTSPAATQEFGVLTDDPEKLLGEARRAFPGYFYSYTAGVVRCTTQMSTSTVSSDSALRLLADAEHLLDTGIRAYWE